MNEVFAFFANDSLDPELLDYIDQESEGKIVGYELIDPTISEDLLIKIKEAVSKHPDYKRKRKKKLNPILAWRVAAVFIGLILLTGIVYLFYVRSAIFTYTTAYGTTKRLLLPDQSKVILNGNSSIQYEKWWDEKSPRKVWITGEGYFSVTHKANNQKFIVITPDGYNIEVLGTEFNVTIRKSKSRVVLNSGKVRLSMSNIWKEKSMEMKPGELVEFKKNTSKILRKSINPALYSSWKDQKLEFDNAPLAELVSILEETYGFDVRVSDEELLNEKIWGSIPTTDVNIFLAVLSKSFHLDVERNDNRITIKRK